MASKSSPTPMLAEFVANVGSQPLPDAVRVKAAEIILDTLGCGIAAWRDDREKADVAKRLAASFRSAPTSVIWGSTARADAAVAALANGILANAADFDDTHKRALLHTGSVVVPPTLALAEECGLSGPEIIAAIVAGYEVAVRVGMAVMPTHYRFWHSTATNGTFGAAASAASAMKLDAGQTLMALGAAGTQAAGLNTFFTYGDMTKSLHPGKASFNGVLSARFAGAGGSSPPTILEHEKGYLNAYSLEPKAEALTSGLGTRWEILDNGFKFFPSILASHSAIQATLDIVSMHDVKPEQIAGIVNETYATVRSHFSAKDVTTGMGARVSVPYCCAVAAIDRAVGQAQFASERVLRKDVQDVLAHTEVVAVDELTAQYPTKFPARITITLKDGRELTSQRDFPKGDPQEPLSQSEIEAKFLENASAKYAPAEVQELARYILALPELTNVAPLWKLLAKV